MSIIAGAWPPDVVGRIEARARRMVDVYGRIAGPMRTELVNLAHEVLGGAPNAESLVDHVSTRLSGQVPADLAGQRFGIDSTAGPTECWPGLLRRCQWNPLHLIREAEDDCLVCSTVRTGETSLAELLSRPDPWEASGPLDPWPEGRVPLLPPSLQGKRVVKASRNGSAWVVTLNPDGSLVERPLSASGLDDSWTGEWGCDSYGHLVIAVGSYQLVVSGRADGLCPGVEVLAPDVTEMWWEFFVGVEDTHGAGHRAVKWVGAIEPNGEGEDVAPPRLFRVTRSPGARWDAATALEESDLFPDERGNRTTWPLVAVPAAGGSLNLQSGDAPELCFTAEITRGAPDAGWPAGSWFGDERSAQFAGSWPVALMPVAPLLPPLDAVRRLHPSGERGAHRPG